MYISRKNAPTAAPSSLWGLRLATLTAFIAYPLGCIVLLTADGGRGLQLAEAIGFAFIFAALISFAIIAMSYHHRVANDTDCSLDEREVQMRNRGFGFGYPTLISLVALFLIYMAIATDTQDGDGWALWLPTTYEHWNALFWGGLLYAMLLPTSYLIWTEKPAPAEEG